MSQEEKEVKEFLRKYIPIFAMLALSLLPFAGCTTEPVNANGNSGFPQQGQEERLPHEITGEVDGGFSGEEVDYYRGGSCSVVVVDKEGNKKDAIFFGAECPTPSP